MRVTEFIEWIVSVTGGLDIDVGRQLSSVNATAHR